MTRLLGVLVGSAIAVAALIVIVGVPDVGSPGEPSADFPKTGTATLEDEMPLPAPFPDPLETAEPTTVPQMQDSDAVSTGVEAASAPQQTAADNSYQDIEDIEDIEDIDAAVSPEQHWYAFWSPFRSQIAANGFVAQLQSVTGLDYRVVTVKPGVYEVAFAFVDDDDLDASLAKISAATGLDVPQT